MLLLLVGLLAVLAIFYAPAAYYLFRYQPQQGDFIFQSLPRTELVRAIEGISRSRYSHVGMLVRKENAWYVREASAQVADTPLFLWAARGRGGSFDVFRLNESLQSTIPAFIQASEKYLGRPYDYRYRIDDGYIYCSELLYKAYFDATGVRLGRLKKLGELDWRPYQATITQYEGGPVPLEREMITPVDLSRAAQLHLVFSSGG
ncbi:YiiX/YebB-like N1pC/P60 family cysteine hydrolase [Chitinimonas sp.]|uniref:YiiX/YebB-like N1pC/P60 family cysteine hydrolase n=1 Tax=Chitinimonas sp. TaxID=1934313 RepID=UPI0035AFCE6F